MNFKDARTDVRAFPKELKKDFKKLLKQQKFYFQRATTEKMVKMLVATIRLLEEGEWRAPGGCYCLHFKSEYLYFHKKLPPLAGKRF
jgi:hypothetical protein